MGKKANPAVVGAFVLGAIALVVLAVIVLGSGRLFQKRYEYVLFFEGNVNGLRVGAAVKFKGVEIGSVTRILFNINTARGPAQMTSNGIRIPVIIELQRPVLLQGTRCGPSRARRPAGDEEFDRQRAQGAAFDGEHRDRCALCRSRFSSRHAGQTRAAAGNQHALHGNSDRAHTARAGAVGSQRADRAARAGRFP